MLCRKIISIIAQAWFLLVWSRELPLAIAKDFDFENILNDFADKKARKVWNFLNWKISATDPKFVLETSY